jgi:DNA-binding transcriptional MerR regulator
MSNPAWNTLQYAKSLQAVGFNAAQAEAIAEGSGIQHHAIQDFATKKELYEVRDQLNQKIDQKFSHLDEKINYLDSKVSHLEEKINCMADVLTSRLFNRLGGLMVACMSIGIGVVTLMVKGV